jgi:hypothetical protein
MKKKLIYLTSILGVLVFFTGCAADLNRYEPRSVNEEAVIKVVMEHERTWNEHDPSGFLATYHDSAKIEYGCEGLLLSKNEFATKISHLMADYPSVKFANPAIDASEKEAVVKVISTELGDENHIFRIEMLQENNQWYIIKETCY